MDKITFEGKTYVRQTIKWLDSNNTVVHEGLQRDLNIEFAKQIDPETLALEQCVAYGDIFKKSCSGTLALKFYECAAQKADYQTMSYILPRMTSCYRQIGQAKKAIEIITFAKQKFGQEMITPALLTSAAAAYCDMEDYARAKKCCDRAYASGGNGAEELSLVYKRIDKAMR